MINTKKDQPIPSISLNTPVRWVVRSLLLYQNIRSCILEVSENIFEYSCFFVRKKRDAVCIEPTFGGWWMLI